MRSHLVALIAAGTFALSAVAPAHATTLPHPPLGAVDGLWAEANFLPLTIQYSFSEGDTLSLGPFTGVDGGEGTGRITVGQVEFFDPLSATISDILWTRPNPFDPLSFDLVLFSGSFFNPGFPNLAILTETGDWQSVGQYFFQSPFYQAQVYVISGVTAPVPLPAALPLFASGLVGMGWLARRKKKMAAAEA